MRALIATLFCLLATPASAELLRLRNGAVDPLTLARAPADLAAEASASHLLVQFDPAVAATIRADLARAGVTIEAYVPDATYRVRRAGVSADRLRAVPGVRWVGAWRPQWKVEPLLLTALSRSAAGSEPALEVFGFVDGDGDELAALVLK